MTQVSAKKVVLIDVEGNYLAPVSYREKLGNLTPTSIITSCNVDSSGYSDVIKMGGNGTKYVNQTVYLPSSVERQVIVPTWGIINTENFYWSAGFPVISVSYLNISCTFAAGFGCATYGGTWTINTDQGPVYRDVPLAIFQGSWGGNIGIDLGGYRNITSVAFSWRYANGGTQLTTGNYVSWNITASQRITISESHAVEFNIGPGTPGTYAPVNFIQPNGDAKTVTQPSAIDCTNFSNGLHDFMLYANNYIDASKYVIGRVVPANYTGYFLDISQTPGVLKKYDRGSLVEDNLQAVYIGSCVTQNGVVMEVRQPYPFDQTGHYNFTHGDRWCDVRWDGYCEQGGSTSGGNVALWKPYLAGHNVVNGNGYSSFVNDSTINMSAAGYWKTSGYIYGK